MRLTATIMPTLTLLLLLLLLCVALAAGSEPQDAPEIPNSAGYIFNKTKMLLAGLAPPIALPSAPILQGEPYAGNRLDVCPAPALVYQWLSKVMGLPAVAASAPACGKKILVNLGTRNRLVQNGAKDMSFLLLAIDGCFLLGKMMLILPRQARDKQRENS